MKGISKMLKASRKEYGVISVQKVKALCAVAGVEYLPFAQVEELATNLYERGYILRVRPQSEPDEYVGQELALEDLEGHLVKGYRVWIDLQDNQEVKVAELS